jgi:hypothetical protein
MRLAALAFAGAIGVTLAAGSANAAPIVPNPASDQLSNIVQVAGGCRWGFHPNRWGRCMPNRYGYARPRPYWRAPYGGPYGGYYRRGPSDYVANQLNAQELGRVYSGGGMPYYRGY